MRTPVKQRPILVTGSHRSGTTWVGRVLSLSGEAEPIHEPFHPAMYSSWLARPPERWFRYVAPNARGPVWQDMANVLALRPAFLPMLRRADSVRSYAGAVREQLNARLARFHRRRPLLKDPIAFFATEWLAQQFNAEPVVLVRHPAAFASSLKRLNWAFDFANLWEQPDLVARYIDWPFRGELRTAVHADLDIIDQAILVWRILNDVARRYRDEHPDWIVLRYEDLASEPLTHFPRMYERLGLRWSEKVASEVRALTTSSNDADVPDRERGGVRRDSRAAMWTWTSRLTHDEIERVRAGTEDVARFWYSDRAWHAPQSLGRSAL